MNFHTMIHIYHTEKKYLYFLTSMNNIKTKIRTILSQLLKPGSIRQLFRTSIGLLSSTYTQPCTRKSNPRPSVLQLVWIKSFKNVRTSWKSKGFKIVINFTNSKIRGDCTIIYSQSHKQSIERPSRSSMKHLSSMHP